MEGRNLSSMRITAQDGLSHQENTTKAFEISRKKMSAILWTIPGTTCCGCRGDGCSSITLHQRMQKLEPEAELQATVEVARRAPRVCWNFSSQGGAFFGYNLLFFPRISCSFLRASWPRLHGYWTFIRTWTAPDKQSIEPEKDLRVRWMEQIPRPRWIRGH